MSELTDLFDMTDTSDVPDAAIEAVTKAIGVHWSASAVRGSPIDHDDRLTIAFARHIARDHPEWIEDPDLATVREMWAADAEREGGTYFAKNIRAKKHDDATGMNARLAAFKAGRAAERAGQ